MASALVVLAGINGKKSAGLFSKLLAKAFYNIFHQIGSLNILGMKVYIFDPGRTIRSMLSFEMLTKKGSDSSSIIGMVKAVNSGMIDFAAAFLLLFFLMELISMTIREAERISLPRLGYAFIRAMFWYAISANSYNIVKWLFTAGDGIIEMAGNAVKTSGYTAPDMVTNMAEIINEAKLGGALGYFIIFVLAMIFLIGTGVAVIVSVAGRVIRIYLYLAFAPLPIAMCANEQYSHTGKRFLANALALGIEGAVMLVIAAVYEIAAAQLATGSTDPLKGVGFVMSMGVLNSIVAAAIGGAQQLAREVTGA